MANAELEKLVKGFEHGSSRDSARSRAGRRGDMDEVSGIAAVLEPHSRSNVELVLDGPTLGRPSFVGHRR